MDFSSGEQVIKGSIPDQFQNCTSKYRSRLPTTVTDNTSIQSLLVLFGQDNELISTTCPEDEDATDGVQRDRCTTHSLTNFVVTDDKGGIHKISTKAEIKYSN